jgi:hypothetical protein
MIFSFRFPRLRSFSRRYRVGFGIIFAVCTSSLMLLSDAASPTFSLFFIGIGPFFCKSSLQPHTFSTSRDIIWTMTLNFDRWFDVSLLSIRTSGCRARIIIFTEINHTFDPHFRRVLALTQAEIYRELLPPENLPNDYIRYIWLLPFLNRYHSEIDRVFMLDAYDVFFHKDPFEVLTTRDSMVFIEEGWTIEETEANSMWINDCYGADGLKIKMNQTICAGTIYGPPHLFIKFIELLLKKWPNLIQCPRDQPVVNWLVYTEELKRVNITTKSLNCTGPVLTLSNCPQIVKPVGRILEGFNGRDEIPHVVHQWKQFEDFRDMYIDRCDMSEYMKRFQEVLSLDLNWTTPVRS